MMDIITEFFSPFYDIYQKIATSLALVTNSFSNVFLNLYIILITAIIFLLLHKFRTIPIVRNISIAASFFPVLIHELGHAITAQLVGGKVEDIRMVLTYRQQQATEKQGYAITKANSKLKFVFITFFGYIAAPLMLFSGVYLAAKDMTAAFLFLCIISLFFYLAKTTQKWIPIILILLVIYSCYNLIYDGYEPITISISIIYNLLLGLLAGETIQSIIITTKIAFSRTKTEWDGSAMRKLTFVPVYFWWLVWTLFSIYMLYQSFMYINNWFASEAVLYLKDKVPLLFLLI